ncbi:MAG: helix-turn-helix domain-containing protein [Planctomycetota bacterium]|nr:helix-turn-helix domain-containing protein [Planctomycetota bacterium]
MAKKKSVEKRLYPFTPDYAIAPGATLAETLAAKGMSQTELAARTGLTEKTISQIINGVAPISFDSALKLEAALGVPARLWNNLERNFQEANAQIAQAERLESDLDWLKSIPVRDLVKRGFVESTRDKVHTLRNVLHFFGVTDVAAWERVWVEPSVAFRRSKAREFKLGLVAAWIRMGELIAGQMICEPYDADKFRKSLVEIRKLTVKSPSDWQQEIVERCADAGVAMTLVPAIPGAGVSGVTKWLSKEKALVQLSLLYKNDGSFWFTFFHEAAHVLLHGKKDVFLHGDAQSDDGREAGADQFARNLLIPRDRAWELPTLRTEKQIREFAQSIGIAPGIVVGRMHHDGIVRPSAFNELKRKIKYADD